MTGWTWLGVFVFIALASMCTGLLALAWLIVAAVRHLIASSLDERTEMRAERHTGREVPPC